LGINEIKNGILGKFWEGFPGGNPFSRFPENRELIGRA